MGKVALLAIAVFSIIGILTGFNQKQSMLQASGTVAGHQYEVLARNVAVTGYNAAKQTLSESYVGKTFSGNFAGGSYQVAIVVNGNVASIKSVGSMTDGHNETVSYTVKADYERNSTGIASEPPSFMKYALISDDNLELSGDVLGEVLVKGDKAASLNANMHTNKNLYITGSSVNVQGFGTFVGVGSSNPAKELQNSFKPNYNPTKGDGAKQAPTVTIPAFDAAKYLSEVKKVSQTDEGDVNISGRLALGGTRDLPFVWYVKGNLTATGNTEVDGYVMFIVEGNVKFNGDVKIGDSGYGGTDESSVAFYTGGNVELGGNTKVYGQIFAGGNVAFLHGTPRIYGSITMKGKADLRGTPKIYYREASPALTTIWEKVDEQIAMLAYSEW